MKRVAKPVFFIVAILIFFLTFTAVFGIYTYNGDFKVNILKGIGDIRWGIDIRGGVEATFKPVTEEGADADASDAQIDDAKTIIETRLINANVTDYELYADYGNDRIIVRYPWKEDETSFDAETAIEELAATAKLTFTNSDGEVLMDGSNVDRAKAGLFTTEQGTSEYGVSLKLIDGDIFKDITTEYLSDTISIYMDETLLSSATVQSVISNGNATISGQFTAEEATDLANKINAGAMPFGLEVTSFGSINPTLGESALVAMAYAGIAALIAISLFMLIVYKLPGFVAVITLIGQVGLSIAAISGYFSIFPSFTMTLPGVAGIILSIGMGVDANIITAERIREELRGGRTIDGAIQKGTKGSISSIIDGNVTVIIVAIILLLVFGPANILSTFFGPSTTGTIYSFGYSLLVGVISNFIMGVGASRLMLKSISGFKFLRKKWMYGGVGK